MRLPYSSSGLPANVPLATSAGAVSLLRSSSDSLGASASPPGIAAHPAKKTIVTTPNARR
jgi:hypothetical protein